VYQQLVAGSNLPDPQVDEQGNDHYPALDQQGPWRWPQSVLTGCAQVWDRVHAIRDRYDSAHQPPPASPATCANELKIARCIRRQGFPTYPNPNANGGFTVGPLPPGSPNQTCRRKPARQSAPRLIVLGGTSFTERTTRTTRTRIVIDLVAAASEAVAGSARRTDMEPSSTAIRSIGPIMTRCLSDAQARDPRYGMPTT
jgi:hypothetical protein